MLFLYEARLATIAGLHLIYCMKNFNQGLKMNKILTLFLTLLFPVISYASSSDTGLLNLHMPESPLALTALSIFIISYAFVMTEEFTHLRKSKPVVISAGIIWLIIAIICNKKGVPHQAETTVRHNILEFSELFMFLLVAMTYVNAMEERLVFESLRSWLVRKGFSYRQLFWVTGILAFFISPIADNLTTALLMCAVILAVGKDNTKFVSISCINVVIAANAGGAFSPFGDITTLMVWQKGKLEFFDFFAIFIPSVISYLIPATIMCFAVPNEHPKSQDKPVKMLFGAKRVMILFLLTIFTAIFFHNVLHLPPMVGMMTGLGYLNFFAFYLKKIEPKKIIQNGLDDGAVEALKDFKPFDIFNKIKRAEWDTLFFFYGVILSVGGLATLGYLELASNAMYNEWGANLSEAYKATPANVTVGFLSAIVDNIPVMFAVLTMDPQMSSGQWLLVTLTAGIGGSMLSIGSAAGVALMGQSNGKYTFFGHLKWSWAILLGYIFAIASHLLINNHMM
jgi:NhaD family Na+/H+ antiporter